MRRAPLFAFAMAVTAWGGAARADLFTPAFIADDGETALCQIANRTRKAKDVVIEIRFNNGAAAATSEPLAVEPGQIAGFSFPGTNSSRLHCAFLGKLSAKGFRVAGEVIADNKTKLVVPGP
jgi:hypothetical protein